jgi:hypothetical protein
MHGSVDSKDVEGFQVGSTAFTRGSSITREWREVARDLDQLVNQTSIGSFVKPGMSVQTVICQIVRSLSDQQEDRSSHE